MGRLHPEISPTDLVGLILCLEKREESDQSDDACYHGTAPFSIRLFTGQVRYRGRKHTLHQ